MATSSSVNYVGTRDTIITEALQVCKVVGEGGSPSSNQLSDCARTLNMMVKAWHAKGYQLWAIDKLILFPVKNQAEYTFAASSADRMCRWSEFIETELNGAHSSGATALTVAGKDGTTNMAASDIIGVQTDSAGLDWSTISGSPTSTAITLAAGLDGAAADNNNVYTYTTAFTQKVLKIYNIWRRTDAGIDIPISMVSRQEYYDISDKAATGPVNQAYFDPQRDTSVLSIWPVPDDAELAELIYMRVGRLFEDFDAASDNPDFPVEWTLALTWNLALLLGPKFGVTGQELREIGILAASTLQDALDFDTEDQSIYIVPDDSSRTYRR